MDNLRELAYIDWISQIQEKWRDKDFMWKNTLSNKVIRQMHKDKYTPQEAFMVIMLNAKPKFKARIKI